MVVQFVMVLTLVGLSTSLTPLERNVHHSVIQYRAGDLSSVELEEDIAAGLAAPFLEDLQVSTSSSAHIKHRSKRSYGDSRLDYQPLQELHGPLHFTELTVDAAVNQTTIPVETGPELSKVFVLGDKSIGLFLAGNQLYQVTNGALEKLTCAACVLSYSTTLGEGDYEIVFTEVIPYSTNGAFIVQAILSQNSLLGPELYSQATFLLTQVSQDISGPFTVEFQKIFQMVALSTPLTKADSLSRISLLDAGEGRILVSSFQRTKSVQRAEGLHLMLYNKDSHMFVDVDQTGFLLDNVLLREWLNDILLVKIYQEERRFLVLARQEETYIFEVDLNPFAMNVVLLQTILLDDPVSIHYTADSFGSFLKLIEGDGTLHSYFWDGVSFITTESYEFSSLADSSWRSVSLTDDSNMRQELVVISNGQRIEFLHNAMPGLLEKMDDPSGLNTIIKNCVDCVIVDLARLEMSSNVYHYFLLLSHNGVIDYIHLHINPTDHTVGCVNDVSICLIDLESQLIKDLEIATFIGTLESDKIPLDSIGMTTLTVDDLEVQGSTSITNLKLNMAVDAVHNVSRLNVNNADSEISLNLRKVTDNRTCPDFIYSNIVPSSGLSLDPAALVNFSINAPEIRINSGSFDVFSVEEVAGVMLSDLLSNTLRVTGDQDILASMTFSTGLTTNSTTIAATATSTGTAAVTLDRYFDTTKPNVFNDEITFSHVVFADNPVLTSTVNSIHLSSIVTEAEMKSDDQIIIEGEKDFDIGLQAYTVSAEVVNEVNYTVWFNSLLYKNLPLQEISVNNMNFQTITVNEAVKLDTLYGNDVSEEALGDIVRIDEEAVITADCLFRESSTADDLVTSSLNNFDPAKLLIDNISQDILVPVQAVEVSASSIDSDNLNGIDLTTQAAKVSEENVFIASVDFQQKVIVTDNIFMNDNITIAGMDPSEVVITKQIYTAPVTVNGILAINTTNVVAAKLLIGEELVSTFTAEGIEDDFMVRDAAQTLPNMVTIQSDINIKEMVVQSTVDNLILANLLHTSGDQTVDAENLVFSKTTFFENDVQVRNKVENSTFDQDALIAGTKIHDLADNVFCNKAPEAYRQMGSLIIESAAGKTNKITAYYDVQVTENFILTVDGENKDFNKLDETAARLDRTNTFEEKINFVSEATSLTVNGDFTSNQPIVGETEGTTLNGRVLSAFENSIVKKTGSYNISGPVTFNHIQGNAHIFTGGLFDGKDLADQLNRYILLDNEGIIENTLIADVVTAGEVNLIPVETTYFSGQDLLSYVTTDLLQKGDVIYGDKKFNSGFKVEGDITVNSDSNSNHPFNVSMTQLNEDSLRLTGQQTISNPVEMADVRVKKLYTNEVNGIEISNLNFIDANVEVKGPAVVFESDSEFVNGIELKGVLNDISTEDRNALLYQARAINLITDLSLDGDVRWTSDKAGTSGAMTLSTLFDLAVVKSDRDWTFLGEPTSISQDITGNVIFNDNVTVSDLNIASGFINQGEEEEFSFVTVYVDSARLSQENVFETSKTIDGTVTVSNSLSLKEIDTTTINDVSLQDFYDTVLFRSCPSGLPHFIQTVEEAWTLVNGFNVTGEALLHDTFNSLKVDDLVYKSIVNETRAIPSITLAKGASVTGNVVGDGSQLKTELDAFLSESIKVDENVNINVPLTFTDTVQLDDITVKTLNGIDKDLIVLTGTENLQTITQDLTLPQSELVIEGELEAKLLNGIDPTLFNSDVLRLDREETITDTPLHFQGQVVLLAENVTITGADTELNNLIPAWLTTLRSFTLDLLNFYTENIIKPIRDVVKELYVAQHLGVGRPCYLEKAQQHSSLQLNNEDYNILSLDSLDFNEGGFMMSVEKGYTGDRCNLTDSCQCKETSLVNGYDFKNYQLYDFTEKVFSFRLESGFYTVTVKYDGSSDTCTSQDTSEIEITGTRLNPSASAVNLTATSVDHLGTILGSTFISGGYAVNTLQMWELGSSLYIAIAPGYSTNIITDTLMVYELSASTWIPITFTKPTNRVQQIITNSFKVTGADNVDREMVHLLIIQEVTESIDAVVDIYEWSYLPSIDQFPTEGVLIQTVSSPGITSLDVLRVQPTKDTNPLILLAMALRFERFFNPTSYISFLQYSASMNKYVKAVVPDQFTEIGNKPILKIKSRQISDTATLLISTEDGISIYSFFPNQGIRLVSEYKVRGRLVDMAVYHETLPRVLSKQKSSTLIYILTELWGIQRTELLSVQIKGKIDLPDVVFSVDEF